MASPDHLTNPANPLFLHPGESPALVLISPPLAENNYQQWKHDFFVALETKNKEKFVLGTLNCPPPDDPLHEAWRRCNKMVIAWLTRSMTTEIKQSVMWMDLAADIWNDLLQRFSHGDKFHVADLQENLQNCHQGDSTVSQYYTRLQIIWKELSLYRTVLACTCNSPCTCGLISKIQKERDDDYIIKFLRGLNDEFSQVRSQIMLMEPMPSLIRVFSLVLQQEREFSGPSSAPSQDSVANMSFQESSNKVPRGGFSNSRGRGRTNKPSGRNAKFCDHCQRTNHTSETCWIKHGLPQGYHQNKPKSSTPKPSASMCDTTNPSTTVDVPATKNDQTNVHHGFSKEQYDILI